MKSMYDDIIEQDFKTDSEGKTVFFAKGLTKPGYELPNEEKKNEIKKIISRYSSLLFAIWFLGILIISHSLIVMFIFIALIILLHYGWYRRKIDQAIVGLPISDLDPKFDSTNLRLGIGVLVVILIFIFGGLFLFSMAKTGGVKGIIISLSLFFVILIVATVGVYFFTMKKKQGKDS